MRSETAVAGNSAAGMRGAGGTLRRDAAGRDAAVAKEGKVGSVTGSGKQAFRIGKLCRYICFEMFPTPPVSSYWQTQASYKLWSYFMGESHNSDLIFP